MSYFFDGKLVKVMSPELARKILDGGLLSLIADNCYHNMNKCLFQTESTVFLSPDARMAEIGRWLACLR